MDVTMIRQGDVLIKRIDSIPASAREVARENGNIVLAHGEITGHAHVIRDPLARMFGTPADEDGPKFIDIPRPASVVHDEHAPLGLEAGTYEVKRQREYSPGEIRRVAD